MGTLDTAVSDLLSWALSLGPVGAWLLPVAGVVLGLLGVGGGYFVAAQRLRRRARDLLVRAKRHIPRGEEGKRVVLVGRLRVAGADAVPSFADGRAVAVSSVSSSQGSVTSVVETRSAPTLALETTEGLVPIEGVIELDRTSAGRRVRSEEPRSYPPELARALRVTDVRAGERVMVEGLLGRVAREGLREPGAVLGVSSETLRFGQVPVRITALRIEAPRALVPMALAGAIGCALCLTPLSLDVSPWALAVRPDHDVGWQLRAAVRLLGPTRTSALDEVAAMPALARSLELGWVRAALQEQGRCYEEALRLGGARTVLASCSDARARVAYLELLRRDQQAPLATGTPAYVWEAEAFATVSHLPLVPWELRHPRPRTGWVRIETPGERAWVIGPRGESWGTTPLTRRVEVGLADISLRYDVPGQRTRVVVEEGETTVIRPRPRHRAGCRSAP